MNLLDLYQRMYLIRRAEETLIARYPENEIRTPLHLSIGSEHIAVGVCAALRPDDQVLTTYRSHAVFLAKTDDTDAFFAELYGKTSGQGGQGGRAGSMHLAMPERGHMVSTGVVGSHLPMALGLAYANKTLGNGRIVAVFFGDATLEQGVFFESLNLACLWMLPVLFVYEENGLSVETPNEKRQAYFLSLLLQAFSKREFLSAVGDVRGVIEQAKHAVGLIRIGSGPEFLCGRYFRRMEHLGIADSPLYKPGTGWPDPVKKARERLLETPAVYLPSLEEIERDVDLRIAESVARARALPEPDPASLNRGVFHEKP